MRNVAVVGSGTMGNGIAHVFAQFGFSVILLDVQQSYLERAVQTIEKNLQRQVKKEKITNDDAKEILDRITTSINLEDCSNCELVVEAVTEDYSIKQKVFSRLNEICDSETIFASNSSSLSMTRLAAGSGRPERFIGMHFMNPVPVMKLVEVIRGMATSRETLDTILAVAEKLRKTPVEVQDYPGFIANRILMPMINEAIFSLMEGVAEKEAIDTVMKLGMAHPMGPLELADFIGLDVCLAILEVLYNGFKDPKYRPCPLLVNMVAAGYLGRKTGRGFYSY
ncbi:MAG: 3-hydroxybutyryl-CoA dehydrogenase [Calditrichia bacterium]